MRKIDVRKRYKLPPSLPPAIPYNEYTAPDIRCRLIEEAGPCTVFEDGDRAIVARFRRPRQLSLTGQVKLDV